MSNWVIYSIGFIAQLLFSARLLVQWLQSEKHKRIITPSIFWKLSLMGSVLLFIYGYYRQDFAIMFGQTLTYFIYIRNLQLQREWLLFKGWIRLLTIIFPLVLAGCFFVYGDYKVDVLFNEKLIPRWLYWLGITSQLLFTLRFVYQWIYSEQRKTSHLPLGFWIMSVVGATLILIYALHRKDPVLILAHGFGLIIYTRNILLTRDTNSAVS
jgi:lipid-A-disaccharide synthase-like uncharacterized protein